MPPRPKSYKPRLATTTQVKLRAIIEKSVTSHAYLREILEWVERERSEARLNMSKARQANVGDLSHAVANLMADLAEIERAAREACDGKIVD